MESHTFTIPNISCGHCTAAIESELKTLDGACGGFTAAERMEWAVAR